MIKKPNSEIIKTLKKIANSYKKRDSQEEDNDEEKEDIINLKTRIESLEDTVSRLKEGKPTLEQERINEINSLFDSNNAPTVETLNRATRLSIEQTKPISLEYFIKALKDTVFIGVDTENNEKRIVESVNKFTEPFIKIYKSNEEFILVNHKTIYITPTSIKAKKITPPSIKAKKY